MSNLAKITKDRRTVQRSLAINSMMFPSFFVLLIAFEVTTQVTFSLNATDVDRAITLCQNEVNRIEATQGRYIEGERKLGEPVLIGQYLYELLNVTYPTKQIQAVFECITDTLNETSPQNLEISNDYRSLTQTCISERPGLPPHCDPKYPYRSINGTCNNLSHPRWGSTLGCFQRLYPANYEGASGERKSLQGNRQLPEPRELSLKIAKPRTRPTRRYNALFVFFGQAVAHDIGEFQVSSIEGDKQIECCQYARTKIQYPECTPILLPPDDPYYSSQNISCLNVVRMGPCYSCSVGKRIQVNQVSHYIDCSLVYGQTDDRAKSFRSNDGSGKLLAQHTEAGELIPGIEVSGNRCTRVQEGPRQKGQYCFAGGDTRTNQHTIISLLQTLLLREHNRVAEKLKMLNPDWEEEKLYQEARKILIAEFQVIIYKEFLPVLIGQKLMTKYGLNIGSRSNYDDKVDPALSVEFNAAAFRIHSLIPGKVVDNEDYEYLRELYVNAAPIYNDRIAPFVSKMSSIPAEKYDRFLPVDLTFWLYRERFGKYGYDLASVDIVRGRDVGLPTFSQVIEHLENRTDAIRTFDDLEKYLVPECQRRVEENYYDVGDIDLWIGLNCERVPDDMTIGPIAAEIIAEQFRRSKYGDRFFVEHDRTLTRAQRQTLMNASLAKLICDNSKVLAIQPMAMLFPSLKNIPRLCAVIPGVNLEKWRMRR